jgi:hypothetical protein
MRCTGSLLAYGQTGAGKTFTLGEPSNIGSRDEGLCVRMLRQLYRAVDANRDRFVYTLSAEYLQVCSKLVHFKLYPYCSPSA